MIVVSVLDVVAPEDLYLAEICILFPLQGMMRESLCLREGTYVEKIDFFQEFLLVVVERANHMGTCEMWR